MIKPEQIPDEVAFALLDIYALWLGDTDQAREAIASALDVWPGAFETATQINRDATEVLILPLTQENTNVEG